MAITADNLVARAREHLTQESDGVKYSPERLYALIPSAIARWIQPVQGNPDKARNFLTETASISITSGVADCSTAIENAGIQSQSVKDADITIAYGKTPNLTVQFVNSRDRRTLGGIQDKFFITAYFDGKKMFFRNPSTGSTTDLSATMTIRGVSVPSTLSAIPTSVEGELATILAELARTFNTDGQHIGTAITSQKV